MIENSRLYNSLRNIFYGILKYTISFIFPFIIRTIMIKKFGSEYTGLGSLFSSILQVLNLSELGFSSAVVFSLYEPIAQNDLTKISALMLFYKKIYRIVGIVIASIGIIICPFISFFISGSYPRDINIYFLFLMFLANTVLSYVFYGYKSALLVANQRIDIENKVQIISNLVCYFLQILVLLFIRNYYIYVIAIIFGTIINNITLCLISKKIFPEIKEAGILSKEEQKNIYRNVKVLIGHQLDAVIINSADSIIISAFLGLKVLMVYDNYNYIINAIISITIIISNAFLASIGNSIVLYDEKKNFSNFKLFHYIFYIIGMFCVCMMLILYQDFMCLWMGKNMLLPFSTVICLVFSFYVRQIRRIVLTYKNATGNWSGDMLKPYISAVVNLIINIILVKIIGLNGVIISTIFCLLIIEAPWEARVIFKNYFKESIKPYVFNNFVYGLKTVIVASVLVYIFHFFTVITLIGFCVKTIFAVFGTLFMCFLFNFMDSEFIKFSIFVKEKILHRRKGIKND